MRALYNQSIGNTHLKFKRIATAIPKCGATGWGSAGCVDDVFGKFALFVWCFKFHVPPKKSVECKTCKTCVNQQVQKWSSSGTRDTGLALDGRIGDGHVKMLEEAPSFVLMAAVCILL